MTLWKSVRNAVSRWRGAGREKGRARDSSRTASRQGQRVNVHVAERLLSIVSGVGIGIGAARTDGIARFLLGGLALGLSWRGITGHSWIYTWLHIDTTRFHPTGEAAAIVATGKRHGVALHTSMVLDRPLAEVFAMWRDLESLAARMTHIESVRITGPTTSSWVARGPFGFRARWDAEITEEIENERIAWRSLPGSDVLHIGSLSFEPAERNRTVLHVHLEYSPLGGTVGAWITKLFGQDPTDQIHEDLLRFKDEIEGRPPRGPMLH